MKTRTFYVHTEIQEVHSIGTVQLAFSCKDQPSNDKPIALAKILMTNDLTMSVAEVVEIYSLRWQIELFFKRCCSDSRPPRRSVLGSKMSPHCNNGHWMISPTGWVSTELILLTLPSGWLR